MEILLVMLGIFGLVGSVSLLIFAPRAQKPGEIIQRRLASITSAQKQLPERAIAFAPTEHPTLWEQIASFFLGEVELPERNTNLSRLLHQAGYPGERALRIFWGVRIFFASAFAAFAFFLTFVSAVPFTKGVLFIGVSAAAGYLLPFSSVRRKAKLRMRSIQETFPDTLDLLVICVEAGMGVDSAIIHVAQEQNEQKLVIGDEFILMSREMHAGLSRREALARLSDRLAFDELKSLATLLVQTEDLGGSIARALRSHADTMRLKRRQKAEEAARKLVIKLLLPMAFCIMPALFMVIFAPPAINIPKLFSTPPQAMRP